MGAEVCDTNVFVYASDTTAGTKRPAAKRVLERLRESGDGVVSVRVLQERSVTPTRTAAPPLAPADAGAVVEDLAAWRVIQPSRRDVPAAIDGAQRWRTSFWDAMLPAAAGTAGAAAVWSEDLNDGQSSDGTTVRIPFRPD
jgi:predicted nucleic acid-binding protein